MCNGWKAALVPDPRHDNVYYYSAMVGTTCLGTSYDNNHISNNR